MVPDADDRQHEVARFGAVAEVPDALVPSESRLCGFQ